MSYLGEDVKKLGFGLMRLPRTKNNDGEEVIDVEQTKVMVDKFLEAGFTYFDTAWVYSGSEEAMRKALVERHPRESYTIATKLAAWVDCKTREDAIKQFETSLERSGAGYFDFYLLHNLGQERTKVFEDFDLWNWALEKKKEGLIKHLGFSFHSDAEELDEILTKHPEAEFVQLQINYVDWEDHSIQSRAVYEVARKHNKPVVIMEPVKGGNLANPPESVKKVFTEAEPDASFASWAIRFAANLPGVITVLSGMSNIQQVEDNLSYMKDFTGFTEEEMHVIERAREEFSKVPVIPCTTCDYCAKVCPMNIGISGSFTALNTLTLYNNLEGAKSRIRFSVLNKDKKLAEECIECGACEEVCPQHIAIRQELKKVTETLK